MKKPAAFVLDSWAILAYFQDEPSAEKVADIMADAGDTSSPLLMSVINVGEVWYSIARRLSPRHGDSAVRELRNLGIIFVDIDWELAAVAARFKSKGGISYAECLAAAVAKKSRGAVITGDREFERLSSDISIIWLPE